jgi:hypothetical protein
VFRGQSGGSLVEFAIVSTVMVPLALASILVQELWTVKLKLQEAARYATWELTAFPLSDFQNAQHDALFDAALNVVQAEVQSRYGDGDMDGATGTGAPTGLPTFTNFIVLRAPIDLAVDPGVAGGINADAQMLPFDGTGSSDGSGRTNFTGPIDHLLFDRFSFNRKGLINLRLTGSAGIVPGFNPAFWTSGQGFASKSATIDGGQLSFVSAPMMLLADDWHLADGAAVTDFSLTSKPPGAAGPYVEQVSRMAFVGLAKGNIGAVSRYADLLGKYFGAIDPPLSSRRLVSLPYQGKPASGEMSLNIDAGQTRFQTTEIRTDISYSSSEYVRTLEKRDTGFLGCSPGQARAPEDGPSYPCDYP